MRPSRCRLWPGQPDWRQQEETTSTRTEFAAELARQRAGAGLSLAGLAMQAHVHRDYAHHVEHGRRWPTETVAMPWVSSRRSLVATWAARGLLGRRQPVADRRIADVNPVGDVSGVAYLQACDRRWRDLITSRLDADHADLVQRALVPFDVLAEWLTLNTRGCCFINAFAELPEPEHPGRQVIAAEKKWLHALFRKLLAEAGAGDSDGLAMQLLSLHEGAIVCYAIANEANAPISARAAAEALVLQSIRHP